MDHENLKIAVLKNGMRVLIYPQKNIHSVAILAIIRAGHLCEPIEKNGIAHLTEHMIFDGTETFPDYKRLSDFFDRIAGEFNGATTYDIITVGGSFVDEEMKNALFVLDQILFHPSLTTQFLEKERSIIMDELKTLEDSPDYLNFLKSKQTRFKGKTILTLPMGGTTSSLKKLTCEDVKNYHSKYFRPDNITLVIVGKCDTQKTIELLEHTFDYQKPDTKLKHTQFSPSLFSDKTISLILNKSKKAYIRITFPSFSWKDTIIDRIALAYLAELLSNRRDSILYSHLREELGWIYDIYTDFLIGFDIGTAEISTSTPVDKSLQVIEEILQAISRVKEVEFEKKRFELIKDIDRKRMKMALDTTEGIIRWFSDEIFYRYPTILMPSDIMNVYDKITTEDMLRVARRIFDMSKINLCILQPFEMAEEKRFKEQIEKLIEKYKK
jgi:predicted Zn-dependent peptidase